MGSASTTFKAAYLGQNRIGTIPYDPNDSLKQGKKTETFIITGGFFKNSTDYFFESSVVNRYDKNGIRERLPNMNIARWRWSSYFQP